ncbi:MAG: hypothetical protein K0R63_936 [Rickettsiales bacterium]|jgi:hypothetical protein|nr:hypothetical protein [Rickettsiales bacterium]
MAKSSLSSSSEAINRINAIKWERLNFFFGDSRWYKNQSQPIDWEATFKDEHFVTKFLPTQFHSSHQYYDNSKYCAGLSIQEVAKVLSKRDTSGRTLLHWSAEFNNQRLGEALIMLHKVSPSIIDVYRKTPADYASNELKQFIEHEKTLEKRALENPSAKAISNLVRDMCKQYPQTKESKSQMPLQDITALVSCDQTLGDNQRSLLIQQLKNANLWISQSPTFGKKKSPSQPNSQPGSLRSSDAVTLEAGSNVSSPAPSPIVTPKSEVLLETASTPPASKPMNIPSRRNSDNAGEWLQFAMESGSPSPSAGSQKSTPLRTSEEPSVASASVPDEENTADFWFKVATGASKSLSSSQSL